MSQSQAKLASLYGFTCVIMIVAGFIALIKHQVVPMIEGLFRSTYEPDGEDQRISFSSVKHRQEVHAYIPQTVEKGFTYPLIACDIKELDKDLIGWSDPSAGGFDKHNLASDVERILGGQQSPNAVFSIVKHWPCS